VLFRGGRRFDGPEGVGFFFWATGVPFAWRILLRSGVFPFDSSLPNERAPMKDLWLRSQVLDFGSEGPGNLPRSWPVSFFAL